MMGPSEVVEYCMKSLQMNVAEDDCYEEGCQVLLDFAVRSAGKVRRPCAQRLETAAGRRTLHAPRSACRTHTPQHPRSVARGVSSRPPPRHLAVGLAGS